MNAQSSYSLNHMSKCIIECLYLNWLTRPEVFLKLRGLSIISSSANPTKWSNTLKQFVGCLLKGCNI